MKIEFDPNDPVQVLAIYNMALEMQMRHNPEMIQKILVPKTESIEKYDQEIKAIIK